MPPRAAGPVLAVEHHVLQAAAPQVIGRRQPGLAGPDDHHRRSAGVRAIMITHANGSSGYIPDDAGFEQIGYEVTTSHLKPGCAENAIVNGLVQLMK